MAKDIMKLVEEYLSDDPLKWSKLASKVVWRRLTLLLLREILLELRESKRNTELH